MWRALGIVLLALGVAGFGLCALCSGAYSAMAKYDGGAFLALSLFMALLTGLCVWGIKRLNRKPPPGPTSPTLPPTPPNP